MSDESRLQLLEERVAWLQKHVLEQDKAMLEMSESLAQLRELVIALRSRASEGGDTAAASPARAATDADGAAAERRT